jgi:acetylornithine/N-succinyldiaminopimelate aminotransferase
VFDGTFLGRTYGSKVATNSGQVGELKFVKCKFNDVQDFKKKISGKTIAVYFELVLGHGGIKKFDYEVIQEIHSICKNENILIFIDEVQTGLGRSGNIFLFQEFNIQPDAVTLGKSLGGGIPLSVVIASSRLSECIEPGDYGCTMGGNSLSCVAGIEIMEYLQKENSIKGIKEKSFYIVQKLISLKKKYPQIKDIRCYGLMCGLEMDVVYVSDVVEEAIKNGLLVDIVNKNTIRLLPPLTVSNDEIDIAVVILDKVLSKIL